MIKITKTDRDYVTIGGELQPAIVEKKNHKVIVLHQKKMLVTLTMEGQCISKVHVDPHTVRYMTWNDTICWYPNFYVNNKRSCEGCVVRGYCQCTLNLEKFNFGVKEDAAETKGTGTELPNDRHEDDAHESEKSENIQEQPPS